MRSHQIVAVPMQTPYNGYTLRQQQHGERQQGSVTDTMTGRETHQ